MVHNFSAYFAFIHSHFYPILAARVQVYLNEWKLWQQKKKSTTVRWRTITQRCVRRIRKTPVCNFLWFQSVRLDSCKCRMSLQNRALGSIQKLYTHIHSSSEIYLHKKAEHRTTVVVWRTPKKTRYNLYAPSFLSRCWKQVKKRADYRVCFGSV